MLKRLELTGFKSFAERTAFDFARGLTAIVGPNGSGKSNIVDAIRWILGEQSAKSLRGGEMADVIFNGSATRRSLGLAEVTMTLDNSRGVLNAEGNEVQVTRRVYRSGEGEYLINGQIARLRDIKEIFLGSGAGTDAYCIIEQGRVDVLLQASTRERRTIFEEAAGISRFKAKKLETHRKLERVDQNLQRLEDILEEVQKQLRSVKLQASKAQRYQEYSTRLRELRVHLGLQEYSQLTERLQAEAAQLESLRTHLREQNSQAEAWETAMRRMEAELLELDGAIHGEESRLGQAREQIATEETTLGHERSLAADLEADLARTRTRAAELTRLLTQLTAEAALAAAEHAAGEAQCQEQRQTVRDLEEDLRATVNRMTILQHQLGVIKNDHLEQMRVAARLQNDAVSVKAQVDNLRRERDRLLTRSTLAAESLASLDLELVDLKSAEDALHERVAHARASLAIQQQERDQAVRQVEETRARLAELQAQRSGLVSRVEVLEGLERSHEGLGSGVREVFALLALPEPGPWRNVLGMIADVLTASREAAPLIDLALGDRAQRFLVRDLVELEVHLAASGRTFSGRVSFLPLATAPPPAAPVSDQPAIPEEATSAARLVACEHPELADLPRRLLDDTLVVPDLPAARSLAALHPGFRFVTRRGELLEADGTLTVGTHHAEAGIISRKSELRELRAQVHVLEDQLRLLDHELIVLRDRVLTCEHRASGTQEEIKVLGEQAADLRDRIVQHRQRREGLHEEVQLSRSEMTSLESEMSDLDTQWNEIRRHVEDAERQVQTLQVQLEQTDREIHEREQHRQHRQQEVTEARVALAQVEERLAALRARHRQAESDLQQRRAEQHTSEQNLSAGRARLAESQRTLLHASSRLALSYLVKEGAERLLVDLQARRDQLRLDRHTLADQTQVARAAWKSQQEQAHARELEVNALGHQRDTLVARLREDYQVELPALQAERVTNGELAAPLLEPSAVNEEITELRRKLDRLGSVNLEALQELAELEERARSLQTQHDDLSAAKGSLEEIIAKINADSRRLFQETFTTVRGYFQELFRKLFGGGMADILLEDEKDILECGIEINARPPGKELRSISLMSGGEKTMTAVALLLAIFRSKPSPFCILDEVDAALDEANVGRFTAVLREFLDRSQFILITHSKRTMAAADVLYGVTMQESGVSKRVAVRFEDWPDETPAVEAVGAGRNGN